MIKGEGYIVDPSGQELITARPSSMRWHHADKLFRAANGAENGFKSRSARALARRDILEEIATVTYFDTARRAPQYVGKNLERTGEFFHIIESEYAMITEGGDDLEITLSTNPKKDEMCKHCIKYHGEEAHCFTDWPSVDERISAENSFAVEFRKWVNENPLWTQGTSFEETITQPNQTIPEIITYTKLGTLKAYYHQLMDDNFYMPLFRILGGKIVNSLE